MKLITRDTDYALRALMYIAQAEQDVVTVYELVQKIGIPRPFLRKILQILQKKGILRSTKGKGGGFSLKNMPKDIRLTDIMEIFQGSLSINECVFKKKKCSYIKTCVLKEKIDALEQLVIKELNSITLAVLLR